MNEPNILAIIQKRTTPLVILSTIFVGVMVLIVPTLIEEAQAIIFAEARSMPGLFFSYISAVKMDEGRLDGTPDRSSDLIRWATVPSVPSGPEKGTLSAWINNFGRVDFSFNKPTSGENTCGVKFSGPGLTGSCNITQAEIPFAKFEVKFKSQQNTNNFCDLLTKFGGEQIKFIQDKLPLLKCN